MRRLVLKMSGEALASSASDETIDAAVVERLAREIATAQAELDLELAIVVGGGNIWRGTTGTAQGLDRTTSDTMGMLATVINALALQDAIERHGQPTRVLSAVADGRGGRALHPPPGHPPPREGPGGDLRRRDGQPVLHDRHLGRPAGRRDRGRDAVEGDALGGRRGLQRRSQARPDGPRLRRARLHGRGEPGPAGHGPHGHHLLQGQRAFPSWSST